MAMSESSGPTGGYGIRPANPSRKVVVTGGVKGSTKAPKAPKMPKPPKASRRGRR